MPSGFQQDINQLSPNFYRVVIDTSSGTYFPTADGNTNGSITPNGWDALATAPTTLVKSKARSRGVMRFRNIVNALTGLGDCQILDITMTGESVGDDQPTACTFTVKFERDAFIPLTGTYQGATAVGNDINGSAMDTVAKAIKNEIAKAMRLTTTASGRVYDPTVGEGIQLSLTAGPGGSQTAAQTLGLITVSLIDTVTLSNA
jgi:hypothetical protein